MAAMLAGRVSYEIAYLAVVFGSASSFVALIALALLREVVAERSWLPRGSSPSALPPLMASEKMA